MIVDNYSTWEESVPGSTVGETTAVVEVPMVYGGDLIGVLGVQEIGTTDRKFTQEDVHILNLFAAQAANAVHNAHLFEETNLRATQFEQLYEAGLTLNIVLDSQAQLKILFTTAKDALGADRAQYYRYDAANNDFQLELSFGDGYHTTDILVNLRNSKTDGIDLFSWIAKHRRSVNLNSTYEDALVKLRSSGIYSGLFVPIEYNQQLLGLFSLYSSRSNAFNAHDERLVTLFANQAAVAMENTRLLSQAQRRLTHVQALRDIDIAIAGSVDLRVTLNVVLERVTSQLQVDAANILLYNPRLQVLEYATSHGFRTRALQGTRMRLDEGYAGKAALERHIVHVPDLRESRDGFERSPHLPSEGFVTYFAVPLIAKGQVKGVLEIFHRSQLDSDQEWLDFLEALAGQAALAIDNVALYENLQRSNTDLGLAYDATIEGWSHALDLRDKETEGHTQRVSEMTIHLARRMGVSEERLVHIQRGSLLHDIGKVGVPDSILFKPGPLTKEEWDIMHMHPVYAFELLSPIAYLRPALEIPYSHHEKWDGTGYPHGLAGEQIPLAARIFAVTDVWDALSSDRPYRRAWERTNVIEYVREQSGKHFDPDVVDVFLQMLNEIGYTKDQEIPEAAMPVWSLR
jgi:HD-GYP domain-containing protein (c-di-GMP phosphodiesterase class II)